MALPIHVCDHDARSDPGCSLMIPGWGRSAWAWPCCAAMRRASRGSGLGGSVQISTTETLSVSLKATVRDRRNLK